MSAQMQVRPHMHCVRHGSGINEFSLLKQKALLLHICLCLTPCSSPLTHCGDWPSLCLSDWSLCERLTSDMGGPRYRLCSEQTHQLPERSLLDNTLLALYARTLKSVQKASHLCVGVVGVPGGPERLLSSDVPHQKVSVLHHYFFNIAANSGWCVDNLLHQTLWREKQFQKQ